MNYILLDLEWNQAYAEQAMAVQKRLGTRLRGEVIQIGAVKMDEDKQICGSFSVIIKPKFFRRIHRHVMQLTGITQDMIDMGIPLEEANARFRRWCGDNAVFLTWGPDDVPMLTDNLRANGLDTGWVPPVYDLQVIYNMQTDGSSRQRSLEYVMEQFEIEQRLPAHDALNDAYFTALVARELDVPAGVKSYSSIHGEYLSDTVIGDADAGGDGYVTITEMMDDALVASPLCPICNKEMIEEDKPCENKK